MELSVKDDYLKGLLFDLTMSMLGSVTHNLQAVSLIINKKDDLVIYFFVSILNEYERELIYDIIGEFEALQGKFIELDIGIIVTKNFKGYLTSEHILVFAKNE